MSLFGTATSFRRVLITVRTWLRNSTHLTVKRTPCPILRTRRGLLFWCQNRVKWMIGILLKIVLVCGVFVNRNVGVFHVMGFQKWLVRSKVIACGSHNEWFKTQQFHRIRYIACCSTKLFGQFIYKKWKWNLVQFFRHDPIGEPARKIHNIVVA